MLKTDCTSTQNKSQKIAVRKLFSSYYHLHLFMCRLITCSPTSSEVVVGVLVGTKCFAISFKKIIRIISFADSTKIGFFKYKFYFFYGCLFHLLPRPFSSLYHRFRE